MYNPSRQEVDSVLADMACHLRMDAHEGAALGAGFHAASVMTQAEFKQRRASAQESETRRLDHERMSRHCPYDTPEPRMTWLSVIWGAAVAFALSVRDVLARLTGRVG